MPWTAKSAPKTVRGKKARARWAKIANGVLRRTGKDSLAKRTASGVMKRARRKKR